MAQQAPGLTRMIGVWGYPKQQAFRRVIPLGNTTPALSAYYAGVMKNPAHSANMRALAAEHCGTAGCGYAGLRGLGADLTDKQIDIAMVASTWDAFLSTPADSPSWQNASDAYDNAAQRARNAGLEVYDGVASLPAVPVTSTPEAAPQVVSQQAPAASTQATSSGGFSPTQLVTPVATLGAGILNAFGFGPKPQPTVVPKPAGLSTGAVVGIAAALLAAGAAVAYSSRKKSA